VHKTHFLPLKIVLKLTFKAENDFAKTNERPKVYFQDFNWWVSQFSGLKQVYNSIKHWKQFKLNFRTNSFLKICF